METGNNQTAVEWLVEMWDKNQRLLSPKQIIEQAKEMEKEQMFKALIKGKEVHRSYNIELEFNEYYNETFNH
jgi:hypothetical protein